jgi:hypothetical protein
MRIILFRLLRRMRLLIPLVAFAAVSPLAPHAWGQTLAVATTPQPVEIDVLPGDDANAIDVGGGGEIEVAILTSPAFDAAAVDVASVCFGDADHPAARDCTEEHGEGHNEDVDGDGDLDLGLHYQEPETGIDPGDTRACLSGKTVDGRSIEGCDDVVTS